MIVSRFMTILAAGALLGLAVPAYAQVTDQTDQSEEDWRKSRKKSGTSDIYRTPNTSSTGVGAPIVDFEPVSPVERLPSDSRRHLMRERAKAIAESDDGDISDAEYVPSEAAKSDENLQREEQEAWEVITSNASGSGGSVGSSSPGENPTAVAGQSGSQSGQNSGQNPSQSSGGGSAASLQEIMDAIKNGRPSGAGSSQGQSGEGQAQSSAGQGQSETSESAGDTGSSGESEGQGDASEGDGGEAGATGDAGSAGEGADAGAEGAASDNRSAAQSEPLSPLERIRRSRDEAPIRGTTRSASDYLGTTPDD